ncbi:MAG: penicillin-binding transpeptidase domain-containing protein, partial [Limisphaerales bacterium]
LVVLLTGLWFVQIVSGKKFEKNSEKQSFRSVRIAPIRGRIFDRNGRVLAENQPRFAINVYLEELRTQFYFEYTNHVLPSYVAAHPEVRKPVKIGLIEKVLSATGLRSSSATLRTSIPLSTRNDLQKIASYNVVSNLTAQIGTMLHTNAPLDWKKFQTHYADHRYVPFTILSGLDKHQVASYAEKLSDQPDVELEIEAVRKYPYGSRAAHLLGYAQPQEPPDEERQIYRYYDRDYRGVVGMEAANDDDLRGKPGTKWIVINNMHYRQREGHTEPSEPGDNVFLTIDANIQKAVEHELSPYHGAAIVMDVNNGDVLAMASSPTFDPNGFANGVSAADWAKMNDEIRRPMFNRATFGAYNPGSTFKIVTALACLESGLDPNELIYLPGAYRPKHGHEIKDTAGPGEFDLKRAFYKSSNAYFITNGIRLAGARKLMEVARRFHLGEKTEVGTPEVSGYVPTPEQAAKLAEGHLANFCIGQEVTTTPIQMACFVSSIANGGKLFWPRVVLDHRSAEEPFELASHQSGNVRDVVKINPRHLEILREAMRLDTENPEANAYGAFHNAGKEPLSFQVAGKTGTAEIKRPGVKDKTTWFVSYAPVSRPRWAVVVMVESGGSGGLTCAPVAREIYAALEKLDMPSAAKNAVAKN